MSSSTYSNIRIEVWLLTAVTVLLTIDIALRLGLPSLLRRVVRMEDTSTLQAGPASKSFLAWTSPKSSSSSSAKILTSASTPSPSNSADRLKVESIKPPVSGSTTSTPPVYNARRKRFHSSSSFSSQTSPSTKPRCDREPGLRHIYQMQAARDAQAIEKLKRELAQVEAKMASNAVQTFCQRLLLSNTVWKQEKELNSLRSIVGVLDHNTVKPISTTMVAVA